MNCDWAYEINQPLACFLNHPQPAAGWNWIGWATLAIFIAIGLILDRAK